MPSSLGRTAGRIDPGTTPLRCRASPTPPSGRRGHNGRSGREVQVARTSAGVLLYRVRPGGVEVLAGHMGGPFWAKKDARAWSLPKGEYTDGEDPLAVARRE